MDRNPLTWTLTTHKILSLSARRAWIEIGIANTVISCITVALRKESVDRNTSPHSISSMILTSLSARRAWIEIASGTLSDTSDVSRSPQGERG